MRVLLIDDEEIIRRLGRLSLTKLGGMDVLEAASGEEGVALARKERPDAVLLDLLMPGLDGQATFAALRAAPETAGIPVVFLTGATDPGEIAALRALGARGVLAKPFDPQALPRLLRDALAGG